MRSIHTSFAGLFGRAFSEGVVVRSVEIPALQRDYAQGRQDARTTKVRAAFLGAIARAVRGGARLGLDFVYGELTSDGALQPVDGQQRLTTLFLLHWYLAARTGRPSAEAPWRNFSYDTRPGARRFCECLCTYGADLSASTPSAWIGDQPWCPPTWREDPTIASMLVVLDDLHTLLRDDDCEAAWSRLVESPAPAITFDVLPVRELGRADELYIRMNSRGKPLTDFEVFKARFEALLEAISPGLATRFAEGADRDWDHVFWPYHGSDLVVDEPLMRYLRFTAELCAWREGGHVDPEADMEAVAAQVFDPSHSSSAARVEWLLSAIETWKGVDAAAFFGSLFTRQAGAASGASDPLRIFTADNAGVDLFGACCCSFDPGRTDRAFGWSEALLLHAVLADRLRPAPERQSRLRIVRNLIESSPHEMEARRMPVLARQVEVIMSQGMPPAVAGFAPQAVAEERAKLAFIAAHPGLGDRLRRLEDHDLLRGSLVAFELDAASFERRAEAFEDLMTDDPARLRALTAALLAAGNPMLRSGRYHVLGSSRVLTPWRDRLTGVGRGAMAATRAALGTVLDVVARRGDLPVDAALDAFTAAWIQDRLARRRLDWRWYLARYPAMRSGTSGRYASSQDAPGYSMCMLDKAIISSLYRDPWLHAMHEESGVGPEVAGQRFSGSESEPRWMLLERSDIGLRAVVEGILVRIPAALGDHAGFADRLAAMGLVPHGERQWRCVVPAAVGEDGAPIDTEDRVQIGARLIRELIDAECGVSSAGPSARDAR